jgi:hypothetical protein
MLHKPQHSSHSFQSQSHGVSSLTHCHTTYFSVVLTPGINIA